MVLALGLAGCPRDRESTSPEPRVQAEPDRQAEQRRAITASVAGYVDALEARDPAAAASWVVSATFGFYDQLRELALTGNRSELDQRSVMIDVMVLELRTRFTRAELEQTDGRALFDDAITAGMEAGALAFDEVWIAEQGDQAEVRFEGQTMLWLAREQGRWCVDLPAMIAGLAPLVEADLVDQVAADGPLRVAFGLLERDSIRGLDLAILDGPLETLP